jgi:hypothetical protein
MRGFFFWTPARLVRAEPLAARMTDWISEELMRRPMSAWWTTLEGRRKSFLRAEGAVVEP